MTECKDRMIRYDMLDLRSQLLLEYLSFTGRPLFKNEIAEQFGEYLKQFGLGSSRCDELVSQLASSGYLQRVGGKFELFNLIREEVSARAAEAGRAALQCEVATLSKFPRGEETLFVKVRRALYLGQEEKARNLLAREQATEYYTPSEHSETVAQQLLKGICSERPLCFYPPTLATDVAVEGLNLSVIHAAEADHLYRWLKNNVDRRQAPHGYHTWLNQELLRQGEGIEGESDPYISALSKIQRGDLSGLAEVQRVILADPLPKGFADVAQEFYYLAACHARNDFVGVEERLRNGAPILHPIMFWFWEVRSGQRNSLNPALQMKMSQREYPAFLQFAQSMVLYWAGFEKQLEPGRVFSLARRYEEAGYKTIYEPLFALYHRLVGEDGSESPFLDLLKPAALWETTLSQLELWKEASEQLLAETVEERVAWVLSLRSGRPVITARVQKRNRSGRWSKGRVVAIAELKYQAFAVLEPSDHRVIEAALGAEHGYRSDRFKVLEALVEHPRLFNERGDGLELLRGAPRLVVHKAEETLGLRLVPVPFEGSRYALRRLSDRRYELVVHDAGTDQLTRLIPREGVDIPLSQEERIRPILAAASQSGFSVESYFAVGEGTELIHHDGKLTVRLYPQGRGLRAEVGVEPFGPNLGFFLPGEGEEFLSQRTDQGVVEVARRLDIERVAFVRFQEFVPAFHDSEALFESPLESLEMLDALRRLPHDFVSVQWPQGKRFALNRVFGSQDVRFSIRRDNDWLSVQGELTLSNGEELELATLIEKHRRQEGRFIELDDGSYIALTEELERRIQALESAAVKEKDGQFLFSELAATVLFEDVELDDVDGFWLQVQERVRAARGVEPVLPSGFQGELRAYQRDGYDWLIRCAAWGAGACLADDMGLGKTVQILACLLSRSSGGPALVVAPTSVCGNWKEEAGRFTPDLEVALYHESDRETVLSDLRAGQVVVCSYGLMCRDIDKLKEVGWHTVVLDESQSIKNTQTQRYKAAIALQADFRIAATGTPVENHLGELWALFRFLNPGLLGSQRTFQLRYGRDESALESLRGMISPFVLRRLKREVLKQLPPKTEVTLSVELSRRERLFYESLRLQAVEKIEEERAGLITILAQLMKLRRACCHPTLAGGEEEIGSSKLESFFELLEGLLEGGHRALVFSQFVDHLSVVAKELTKRKIGFQYLDGSTPAKKRAEAVRVFQDGEGDLFLISLKAGGTGLNLTAANYVIHLDPWWNPATEDQASDRAHRIGQEQAVTVYRLIAKDTIEEKILNLHKEKREMVDSLLEGTDQAVKLSAEELLDLLREGAANQARVS